jgi:outer membrane lipoprotein carrier protein
VRCGLAVGLVVLALDHSSSPVGAQEDPTALATRIQARYDTVRDFQADFEQSYVGGALRRRTSERGTMQVKKPGRMRWEYTRPERKLFIADGRKTYAYVPADKQVMVADIPGDDRASTPILFLAGKGILVRDVTVSSATVANAPADTVALTLTPRRTETEYSAITLVVDRATLAIRMFVATDAQGGTSTFTFTNMRENVNPSDKSFTFTIPKGVDVVTQD